MKDELRELIRNCDDELDDISKLLEKIDAVDKERMYLTNYALIKASGTIEFVYRSIVADSFHEKLHDDRIDNFLENKVRLGSLSCKYDNMCKLLNAFDPEWKKQFHDKVEEADHSNRLKTSSNSLAGNRNLFSHGKNPSCTFNDIKQYYHDLKILVNIFDAVVEGV